MNIRELILDSKEILYEIDNGTESFKLNFLSKSLDIEIETLMELFENENIVIDPNLTNSISTDLIKQIILKEPETSSTPKSLRELILSSKNILEIINADNGKDYIRLNRICRAFDMGVKNIIPLFNSEGIDVEHSPNARLKKETLRELISKEQVNLLKNNEQVLKELEEKIKETDNNEYTKSVVLNQFIRSEQIRQFAKIRANGICELCDLSAPFEDKFGNPFLECHHIIYLAKGGKDTIENVAALCPNCHRKIHNLNLKSDIQKLLNKRNLNSEQEEFDETKN